MLFHTNFQRPQRDLLVFLAEKSLNFINFLNENTTNESLMTNWMKMIKSSLELKLELFICHMHSFSDVTSAFQNSLTQASSLILIGHSYILGKLSTVIYPFCLKKQTLKRLLYLS